MLSFPSFLLQQKYYSWHGAEPDKTLLDVADLLGFDDQPPQIRDNNRDYCCAAVSPATATDANQQNAPAAAADLLLRQANGDCIDRLKVGSSNSRGGSVRRVAFRTESETVALDDGYRWRKYGKKMIKNSPYPRNYYRCLAEGCNVKKRAEREREDPRFVITTYEGVHSHHAPRPPPFANAASSAAAKSSGGSI